MREGLERYIGHENMTLVDAMQKINENSRCMLYIVDDDERLVGSLTDGDIRWWIVDTGDLNAVVSKIVNRNVKFLYTGDSVDPSEFMRKEKISSVPIINKSRNIEKIRFINDEEEKKDDSLSGIPIIIMAGGKGSRLRPFTRILPKPLIPIKDVPILERIMNRFYLFGAHEFYLTVNYRKEMIKSYFLDMELPYEIHYVEEEEPLGTAGSIRLIERDFDTPVIVTNCDTLIRDDYGKMLDFHREHGYDMTIISAERRTVIPYGVLYSDKGAVTSMKEKPEICYTINTGMYIVNPAFLGWIPPNSFFHMTDLAERMLKDRKKVGIYSVSEDSFLDMGEFEEMKRMEDRIGERI